MQTDLLRSVLSFLMVVYIVDCYPYLNLFNNRPDLTDLENESLSSDRRAIMNTKILNLLLRNYADLPLQGQKSRNQQQDYSDLIDSVLNDEMERGRSKRGPGGCDAFHGCGK